MTTIYFSQQLRSRWPNPLADEWAAEYPMLFDEDDLRITRRQPRNHFCEWFAAIQLFQREGVLSLVEKYLYANHARKQKLMSQLLNPQQRKILEAITAEFEVQPPDLLVFTPDHARFWFAEVKGPGDKLHTAQTLSHEAIRLKLGVQVELIWVTAEHGDRRVDRAP